LEGIAYEKQRVLILAPHADDETLGCGGVIQKYISRQCPVRVVIATFRIKRSKRYKKDLAAYASYQGNTRMEELKKAMTILGVSDYPILFLDESDKPAYDSMLDVMPRATLVDQIEKQIADFDPTVIYIPSITKHQDHEALHRAAVAATRPYYWNGTVYVYETDGELDFRPQLYVPLSEDEMTRKMDALKAYQTQVENPRHPVHAQSLLYKAKFRGNHIYEDYAEAFEVIRLRG